MTRTEYRKQTTKNPPEKPIFEQICDEINTGGLSILSEAAKDRIKEYVRRGLKDGYEHGYADAARLAAEDAAGENI